MPGAAALGRPLSSAASELMRRIELRLPAFSEGGAGGKAKTGQ